MRSSCVQLISSFFSSKTSLTQNILSNNSPLPFICLTSFGIHISNMSKSYILQNKAIKLICDGKKSDHETRYYSKLNILKLQNLCKYEVAKIVFRFSQDNFPPTLQCLFSKTSEIFFRNTRSSTNIYNLYILRYMTTRLQKSIKYQGVKIWNKVSPNLKNKSNKNFKRCYKKFLTNS